MVMLSARKRLRRRGHLPPTGVSRIRLTTLPTDIDLLRHMNNGRYLSLFDLGRWDLLVYGEGSAATEIAVNAPGDAGRLILPQGCTLRVKVNALADAPVPAKVSLTGAGGRPFRALGRMGEPATSWDLTRGTFIFSRLPPGTWEVQATAADRARIPV